MRKSLLAAALLCPGLLLSVAAQAADNPDSAPADNPDSAPADNPDSAPADNPDSAPADKPGMVPATEPPSKGSPSAQLPLPAASPSASFSEDASCQDTWPTDRDRPQLVETFPKRGVAGHVTELRIEVRHLPGEVVFPAGLSFSADAPEVSRLREAHFVLPKPESDVQPRLEKLNPDGREKSAATPSDPTASAGKQAGTRVTLPFIPLPKEAGRHELTLPRFPISVARASGQVHTLCTDPHVILVEDPLASVAEPEKQPDPEPRPQLEVWTTVRDTVLTLAWAVPLVLAIAYLLMKHGNKWKKVPPPPPPVPPWQTAREKLRALRARQLLAAERFEEELDEICDILRQYLGARYGFDGLECTTRELLRELSSRAPDFPDEQAVRSILQRADLVKFARKAPSRQECEDAMGMTETIIEHTRPGPSLDPRATNEIGTRGPEAPRG